MIIELIIIVTLFFIFKWIYLNNLLFFLDLIAEIITRISLFNKSKDNIINFNLNLVYQKKLEINEINKLNYTSRKLSVLNFLIALHQRFLINNDYLLKYYFDIKLPNDLKEDIANNKAIFAMAHYGIYYDFTSFLNSTNYYFGCVYKMKNKILEKIVYDCKEYQAKVTPILYNKLALHMKKNYDIITIPCDHKNKSNKTKINFLGQKTGFHFSVADIHKITGRSIWVFLSDYNFETKKISIKLIPIQRKLDSTRKTVIVQKIADTFTNQIMSNPEQYSWNFKRF